MTYYLLSVLILALLLLWPVRHLIWVLSVRRLQGRVGRELNEWELSGQRNRALFIALLLCLGFSALFNLRLLS